MSYFFSLYWSLSSSSCTVFGAILSNIYEVLSINQSAKVFAFGDLKVHQKDWIIYSGETDRPGKFCCNFSISNNLTQMVNSPTQIPDCESQSYSFKFIYMASDPVAVSISTDFLSISKGNDLFIHSLWLFLGWLVPSSLSFERCSMGGHLF